MGRPLLPRQPHHTVAMGASETARDVLLLHLVLWDLLQVSHQTQPRQIGGGPRLVVGEVDELVPPAQGKRDVRAGVGIQGRRGDFQGEDRRIAILFARGDILGQSNRGVSHVGGDALGCNVLGEHAAEHTRFRQGEETAGEYGRFVSGRAEDGGGGEGLFVCILDRGNAQWCLERSLQRE